MSRLQDIIKHCSELEDENARLKESVQGLQEEVVRLTDPVTVECHLCGADTKLNEAERVYGMFIFECPKCSREMNRIHHDYVAKLQQKRTKAL